MNKDPKNLGALSLSLTNLLSYKHGSLVETKEVFQAIFEIISLFQIATSKLKEEISFKESKDQTKIKKDD